MNSSLKLFFSLRLFKTYSSYTISSIVIILSLIYFKATLSKDVLLITLNIITMMGFFAAFDLNMAKYYAVFSDKNDFKVCQSQYYASLLILTFTSIIASFLFWLNNKYFHIVDIESIYGPYIFIFFVVFAPFSILSSTIFAYHDVNDKYMNSSVLRLAFSILPYIAFVICVALEVATYIAVILMIISRFFIVLIGFLTTLKGAIKLNKKIFKSWISEIFSGGRVSLYIGFLIPVLAYMDRILAISFLEGVQYNDYVFFSELSYKVLTLVAISGYVLIPRLSSSKFINKAVIKGVDYNLVYSLVIEVFFIIALLYGIGIVSFYLLGVFDALDVDFYFVNLLAFGYVFTIFNLSIIIVWHSKGLLSLIIMSCIVDFLIITILSLLGVLESYFNTYFFIKSLIMSFLLIFASYIKNIFNGKRFIIFNITLAVLALVAFSDSYNATLFVYVSLFIMSFHRSYVILKDVKPILRDIL